MNEKELLKEFKKTPLGKNYILDGYTDKEILKNVNKKTMLYKIKNIEKSKLIRKTLDRMLVDRVSRVPTFRPSLYD